MSRSKRDVLDTEAMLGRLAALLYHALPGHIEPSAYAVARADAESLRRISMTLHRWHELECGDSNDRGSWTIVRGYKIPNMANGKPFEHDDDGKPYLERHVYRHGHGKDTVHYDPLPDRETGARKRLAKILARYPGLTAYVQTDPRGCALYVLKPGDVLEGMDVSSCYSNGLAVHQ